MTPTWIESQCLHHLDVCTHRPHVTGHGDVIIVDNLRSQELRSPAHGPHLTPRSESLSSSKVNDLNLILFRANNILRLK